MLRRLLVTYPLLAALVLVFDLTSPGLQAKEPTSSRQFNFENDIIPILSRFGCNTSGCHGKAEGQNGFKLSVFGFDPPADFLALTQEGRGRRVVATLPEQSLLLSKASGGVPHGGGVRIEKGSDFYRTLRSWIEAGMPFGSDADPVVRSIAVEPQENQLGRRARQPLKVIATYSDGEQVDVTRLTRFQSNNEGLATVDEAGTVTTGDVPGDVAIMASYMGQVDVFRALLPRPEPITNPVTRPEFNFIDGHVDRKLKKLNILPSELCTDADFLRRTYLDIIGTLPTADESRKFLADDRSDKRTRLVDELLDRPEYSDFWALRWADVLRVDRQALGHRRAYEYYSFIRQSLKDNKPYDLFCREIVAAKGTLAEHPGGNFFNVVTSPGARASTISQVFMGVRIECAQCHHHPFDRWSQTDYLGMTGFFTQVATRQTPTGDALFTGPGTVVTHPRTGETVYAHPLGTENPRNELPGDRRQEFGSWLTARENPWFARNLVNRMWAHFLGRGLVEPIDDVRSTNPPTNPELLDALAASFTENRFDLKQMIRVICASRTYQTSATPNDTNRQDDQNYSRALLKRPAAEVLFDAVCQVTGIEEKFAGVPEGYRAIQLWDSQVPHEFLKLFGRPTRVTACECERTSEPSVAQVLHVLNSPSLQDKLAHAGGTVARLDLEISDDGRIVDELFLTCFSRYPTPDERSAATESLTKQQKSRRQAIEDLTWSLLNTVEFVFNH